MPVWNYNLTFDKGSYWIDVDKYNDSQKDIIEIDHSYALHSSTKHDAAWQAWQRGFINTNPAYSLEVKEPSRNLIDNYRFTRKYFNSLWAVYILFLRIICFNNPFKEFLAFWTARKVNRLDTSLNHFDHSTTLKSRSLLIDSKPLVSVIIPTLNRYEYLKDALKDLEAQSYTAFETIVVDQSNPFKAEFYKQFLIDIKVVRQEERALWQARNHAINISTGDLILLFDDDSRVEPDWIEKHLLCIDFFKVDISSGTSISVVGAAVPKNYRFFRWGDQLDTGNAMVKKDVFNKIGLFDRQFERQRMGDGEFGLRAYLSGYKNISNPMASRLHLKVGEGGLREMGSWDSFRPKNIIGPRPIPSVLYLTRRYFGRSSSIMFLLKSTPPSIIPYRFKSKRSYLIIGSVISIFLFPIILFQVCLSWRISSKMIRQGSKIEK
jgi:glycosyltransferase involved in cell wall biosynthesis